MEQTAQVVSYILAFLIFVIGGVIYLAFRSEELLMFSWARDCGLGGQVTTLRKLLSPFFPSSEWVLYSLPDGLWVLSYVVAISALWKFQIQEHWMIVGFIPAIAIGSELLQAVNIMPGTFDFMDLITYVVFSLFGIIYSLILKMYLSCKRRIA